MMVRIGFAFAVFLAMSFAAQAKLMSYQGYTYDSDSKIVSNGTLEWLRWDETLGLSGQRAYDQYATSGWMIASSQQMTDLFNDFSIAGSSSWVSGIEDDQRNNKTAINEPFEQDPEYMFLSLFGASRPLQDSGYGRVNTLFGGTFDGYTGDLQIANVINDTFYSNGTSRSDRARLTGLGNLRSSLEASSTTGIALVRTAALPDATDVPEPSFLVLFSLTLLGLLRAGRSS